MKPVGGSIPSNLRVGVVAVLLVTAAVTLGAGVTNAASADNTYSLFVSTSPDRSSPVGLDGQSVAGDIYVFTSPQTDVRRVRFYVDDPTMSGTPYRIEGIAPHDLAGSATNGTALPFDTTTLADGSHNVTAVLELRNRTEVATAGFVVQNGSEPPPPPPPPPPPSGYTMMVSTMADRSSPTVLEGNNVAGTIYTFVSPGSGITRVRFFVDDPTMTGLPYKSESAAPHDLAGTAKNGTANPFDTTKLADGTHNVTAAIELSAGGTEVIGANFTTSNQGPALSFTPGSLSFAVEPGAGDSQTLALDTTDGGNADFTVTENASWLAVAPGSGSTPNSLTASVDTVGLASGTYTATITATAPGYADAEASVLLAVGESGQEGADQIHLAWAEDPSTTMTVVWRTLDTFLPSTVQFRRSGDSTWSSATGAPRPSGTTGTLHEVTLRSLTPSTTYEYRVTSGVGEWSQIFTTETAPSGPGDFDVVYVADTGIAGRSDGLTTGTAQVIDEIDQLDPLLVLLGGDYAYYNSETRFPTLDDAIDAWFNQMQPIGTESPMMVAYGNHEILLDEGFQPWAARFPTPPGFDGRRNYSFDVGDAHFISVFAFGDGRDLPDATFAWLEQDIQAANAAGARWVIPFFHVGPFADGLVHPSNLELRAQLGPLFERLGIKLAIYSHDQSYERTYPLVDVPATNSPTSSSLSCYTFDDGVTWVKVSPGGKLSNKNRSFSTFTTNPPPPWTAVRDATMHHFLRVRFSSQESIRVEAFGVKGDGSAPVVQDAFTYTAGTCGAELSFDAEVVALSGTEGGPTTSGQITLEALGGSTASYSVADDAAWLTVQPNQGSTPATLTVTADPAGLAPGTYQATVTATAPGYTSDQFTVTFSVEGSYNLLVSSQANRSAPLGLAGRTVSGNIYAFVSPATGISRVRFYIDDPTRSGSPFKTESNGPWDFAGTATNGLALPFDTTKRTNGLHNITAAIDFTSGDTEIVSADFQISNGGP